MFTSPRFCSSRITSHTEAVGGSQEFKVNCPSGVLTTMAAQSNPTAHVAPATEDEYDQLVQWSHAVLERNNPALDNIYVNPERAAEDTPRTRTHRLRPPKQYSQGAKARATTRSVTFTS